MHRKIEVYLSLIIFVKVRRLLRADISAISVQTRLVYDNKPPDVIPIDSSKPLDSVQTSFLGGLSASRLKFSVKSLEC